jgi:hypothetical protein
MQVTRWAGLANPGAWLVLLGFALLLGSIYVPIQAAQRTARWETRAAAILTTLLAASRGFPLGIEPADEPILRARFHALAARDQLDLADLQMLPEPLAGTVLACTDGIFAYHLAGSPPDPQAMVSPDAVPAYEAMAWPLREHGPVHSVFFSADNAPQAFTRNLAAGYHGLGEQRPRPGHGQRRNSGLFEVARSYRSSVDERWMLH